MRPINYEAEVDSYLARPKQAPILETRGSELDSDLKGDGWLFNMLLGRAASVTGISINPLKVMGIATFYACARVHAETMASLPCVLMRGDGKDGQVLARDHRMFSVMYNSPNAEMTIYDFISAMEGNLSVRHNAYAEILRDGDGDPIGLYPVDPTNVSEFRENGTLKLKYQYTPTGAVFKAEDMLHLRNMSRNGLVGVDVSMQLQEVFALALALQDNAAKFFGNGSRPGAVLEHPAVMSEEAANRLKKQIEENTTGQNLYRTLLLEEGMKWIKQRSENRDSQFLESREYQDLQICRVMRVPPHKVGIKSNEPRANVEEENLAFVGDVIRPKCVNWEKALNMKTLTLEEQEQGFEYQFQLDELLRGNMKARYDSYAVGRQWGFLSVNQVKKKERMNPIGPDGDMHLQPSNMVPLGTKPGAGEVDDGEDDEDPKKKKSEDKDAKGKKEEGGDDAPPKSSKPEVIAGGGGIVPQVKVTPIIEQPPGKPKNLAGIEDSITINS